jgi:hypothetical protein
MRFDDLPDSSYLRARELVRSRDRPGIVPVGLTTWGKLVAEGKAPKPEFPFGPAVALWRVGAIRGYLRSLNEQKPAALETA